MPTMNKMLERALNTRRSPHAGEDGASGEDEGGDETADESKTRKHISVAMRVSNYLIRTGYIWPLLIMCIAILIISSLVIHSRDLICIPAFPSHHVSRLFSGSDGLESDFGSLGAPWCRSKHGKTVEWTKEDLIKGLEEFVPIYETRPIKNNMYGMGFDHSFGLWFITRWVKPELMIESGAFKGHSTWVLRQAMPDTHILSLSPRHPEKYLKKGPAYVDGNCTYFAGKDFVDFGSMDWKKLKQALKAGFKHLVFEDNYDTGTGDHYSFRQICDQFYIRGGGHSCFKDSDEARIRSRRKKLWEKAVDIDELCGPGEAWWGVRGHMRDDFNHSNKAITYAEHFQNSRYVESVLDVYWELPPVAGPSLTHQTRYDPARAPNPIVEDGRYGLFQRVGLSRLETSVFNGYTQMVYLQVSEPET
ncbi:UNVERIFIED_CONTAM: hypothetical protein Slati_0274300 [Sesamum latifolium]|uniref:Uncharacterized protein n=1 Tax=Sesamum latifolium TaxID=2727402 RepID=A0AAW2YEN9_9LAMI